MDTEETLTGKTRYRTQHRIFNPDVLVLQVEVNCKGWDTECCGVIEIIDIDYLFWRDAGVEDLGFLKENI